MLKLQLPDMSVRELFTRDWRQVDWRRTVLLVLLILAIAAAAWQYFCPRIRTINQWQFHPVPVIKETVKIKKVYAPCPEKGLVVLDKREVADKLDLPWLTPPSPPYVIGGEGPRAGGVVGEEVPSPSAEGTSPVPGNPADLQVSATADIPESRNGVDVISVINTATGETTLVAKEQPAPWFQLRNDAAMGIRYGLCAGTNTPYCGDVYGRWDFLRMKNVYLSVNGGLSTEAEGKIQFGAEYRW